VSKETERGVNDALRKVVETWQGDHPEPGAAKAYADALAAHEWDAILEERGRLRQAEHEARTMSHAREEELRAMVKAAERLHVEVDMLLAHGPLTMTEEVEKRLRARTDTPEFSMLFVELDKLRQVYGVLDSRFRTLVDNVEQILEGAEHGLASGRTVMGALGHALAIAKGMKGEA
jgi:hypothetical protein